MTAAVLKDARSFLKEGIPGAETFGKTHSKKNIGSDVLRYHHYGHSLFVSVVARRLGEAVGLSEHEKNLLKIAAIFHDAGYAMNRKIGNILDDYREKAKTDPDGFQYKANEPLGARIAGAYMKKNGFVEKDIEQVKAAIMGTQVKFENGRLLQSATTKLGELLDDADLANVGSGKFETLGDALNVEFTRQGIHKPQDPIDWLKGQIKFLQDHKFYTQAAIEIGLERGRRENITRLSKKLVQITKEAEQMAA